MAAVQESKKRSRKQYTNHAAKKQRGGGARELEVGMQGILITCNMNQRKCTAEAYSLLNEYADKLYGPEKFTEEEEEEEKNSDEEEKEEDDDDAEAALKKEVKQIRSSTAKKQRRFLAMESGANNVVFVRTLNIDPNKLVHHILQDLHTTKKKKSRVILRMLPVSGTCKAFIEEMEKYLGPFLESWFKAPNQGTFQIVFKARNSSHAKRDEVIKVLAGLVGNMNPKNKVDLTNPEYTIIVEIIKNVCCVSVVRDYVLFRKFNLQEVVKNDGEPQDLPSRVDNFEEGKEESAKETESKSPCSEECSAGIPKQESTPTDDPIKLE